MADKAFRALGATVILVAIAFAGISQRGSSESSALEMTAEPLSTLESGTEDSGVGPIVTGEATEPFEYRVGLLSDLTTNNFWAYQGRDFTVWNAYVLGATKPGLLAVDPVTNQVVLDLAAAVATPTSTPDGWQVSVDLQAGQLWSDGAPITARDLEFTFDTVRRLGLKGGWDDSYPSNVADVVVVTDHEVTIEFVSRPSLADWPYGIGLAPIMPQHVWETSVNSVDKPGALYAVDGRIDVSGGPIEIVSAEPGHIRATPHRIQSIGGPSSISYFVFDSEEAAVAAISSGSIDTFITPGGVSLEAQTALMGVPNVNLEQSPANSIRYLGFNLEREPMSDPAFRTGLARLFDRDQAAIEIVGGSSAAYTLLPPSNNAWFDEQAAASISAEYRPSLAKRLAATLTDLAESGYAWKKSPKVSGGKLIAGKGLTIDGEAPPPLTVLTSGDKYDSARPAYTALIEETIEVLGFDVRPVETDFETVVDLAFTPVEEGPRTYDMYVLGWTLGNPAYPDFYGRFFAGERPANSTGFRNQQFNHSWQRYLEATDHQSARAAIWEMEGILADQLPYLVLYHPTMVEPYRSDRLTFSISGALGGLQGRIAGLGDLIPIP